jgi:hypothetical protein
MRDLEEAADAMVPELPRGRNGRAGISIGLHPVPRENPGARSAGICGADRVLYLRAAAG